MARRSGYAWLARIEVAEAVLFFVDGEFVEDLPVDDRQVRLDLDTREEQSVPEMSEDSEIVVTDAHREVVILRSHPISDDDEIGCGQHGWVVEGDPLLLAAPSGSSLQWRLNGVDIEGATSRTLVFESAAPSDSGAYTVVYDNGEGKILVETAPFFLEVLPEGALPAASASALALTVLALAAAGTLRKKKGLSIR